MAEALEMELRRLVALRAKPEEAEALKREAPRRAQEATSIAMSRRATIVGLWKLALEYFEDGSSAEQSLEMLQAIRHTIENWLRVVQDCRDLWRLVAEVGGTAAEVVGPPQGVEGLDATEQEVKRIAAAVEHMQAFMTRARPPIAPDALDQGRREIAENRYRTAEEIRMG